MAGRRVPAERIHGAGEDAQVSRRSKAVAVRRRTAGGDRTRRRSAARQRRLLERLSSAAAGTGGENGGRQIGMVGERRRRQVGNFRCALSSL